MYMHSGYIFMLKRLCLFLPNFPPYYVKKKQKEREVEEYLLMALLNFI